jgi:hypothetical protein
VGESVEKAIDKLYRRRKNRVLEVHYRVRLSGKLQLRFGPNMPLDRLTLSTAEEFEHEYEEFEDKGLDMQGSMSDYKKGDELWFQLEAGLPRTGLDLERDTTHISDEELVRVFGKKVQNKGYSYKDAAVEQVTSQDEELYMPIYQVDSTLDQFILESFARALVSEVCHGT